jgi:hypothetical protein
MQDPEKAENDWQFRLRPLPGKRVNGASWPTADLGRRRREGQHGYVLAAEGHLSQAGPDPQSN